MNGASVESGGKLFKARTRQLSAVAEQRQRVLCAFGPGGACPKQ